MRRLVPLAAWLVGMLVCPSWVRAAAVLIPDHEFRLGSCGGPAGPSCSWECGQGKGCAGGGQCTLQGAQAFGAALVARADAASCGGASGAVLTLGLAGSIDGAPFQLPDTEFDLCGRDILCTGRQPRSCSVCQDDDPTHLLCLSDDGHGDFPCPPGNVSFFCKDPCSGGTPGFEFLSESDMDIFAAWFSETRQPLPNVIRSSLPNPPAVGRPVVYFSKPQLFPVGDPPTTRACVRILYTSQDKPLGVCSSDPRRRCATKSDCASGDTCLEGTPPGVNPAGPDQVVSQSVCTGGSRAGKPCAASADCDAGSCTPLGSIASTKFCSESLASCADSSDCPAGQACIECPQPACGDAVQDPGEECDDGNLAAGDGCDGSCRLEPCFDCERDVGEQSLCFPSAVGTPCDADGTACTAGTCNGSGACTDGGALTGCAPAAATKAKLLLKRNPDKPQKNALKWKWVGADAFATSGLGDPSTADDVTLCLFDQTGLRAELRAPAGGLCRTKPCWNVQASKVKYKDPDGTPDGILVLSAKSGAPAKGTIQAMAKGTPVVLPLPLSAPVRMVAVRRFGPACFEAEYATPSTNDDVVFKAAN